MALGKYLARIMRSGHADISAWLLIAFASQLILPITVLALETADSDYQAALRNSICQVSLSTEPADPGTIPHQTDDFVCNWCLLSYDKILRAELSFDTSPSFSNVLLQSPSFDDKHHLFSSLKKYISPPRAPPVS